MYARGEMYLVDCDVLLDGKILMLFIGDFGVTKIDFPIQNRF